METCCFTTCGPRGAQGENALYSIGNGVIAGNCVNENHLARMVNIIAIIAEI